MGEEEDPMNKSKESFGEALKANSDHTHEGKRQVPTQAMPANGKTPTSTPLDITDDGQPFGPEETQRLVAGNLDNDGYVPPYLRPRKGFVKPDPHDKSTSSLPASPLPNLQSRAANENVDDGVRAVQLPPSEPSAPKPTGQTHLTPIEASPNVSKRSKWPTTHNASVQKHRPTNQNTPLNPQYRTTLGDNPFSPSTSQSQFSNSSPTPRLPLDIVPIRCKFDLGCQRKSCNKAHQSPAAPPGIAVKLHEICQSHADCEDAACDASHNSPISGEKFDAARKALRAETRRANAEQYRARGGMGSRGGRGKW